MKRHLLKLLVVFGVLALAAQAQAVLITPDTDTPLTGLQTSQSQIDAAIALEIDPDPVELYKATPGVPVVESGSLAGSYTTVFLSTPSDPSGATITHEIGTPIVGPTAYLLVKDGEQDPAWYFFNLTALGWTGTQVLDLSGFWPNQGAISHVTLYGTTNTTSVPEPGTLLLLGSGLVGLALYGRKTFKR